MHLCNNNYSHEHNEPNSLERSFYLLGQETDNSVVRSFTPTPTITKNSDFIQPSEQLCSNKGRRSSEPRSKRPRHGEAKNSLLVTPEEAKANTSLFHSHLSSYESWFRGAPHLSSILLPTIALGTYYTPLEIRLPRSTRVDSDATQTTTTTTKPTDAEQAAEELTQLTDSASTTGDLKRSRISAAKPHARDEKRKKRRELSTVPPGDTRPPLRRRSRQQLRPPPPPEEDRLPVGSRRKRRGGSPRAAASAAKEERRKEKKEQQQKRS